MAIVYLISYLGYSQFQHPEKIFLNIRT